MPITATEVEEILERRGWTVTELADACFVARATAYNWVNRGCNTKGMSSRLNALLEASRIRDARMAARKPRRSKA
jgi:plasmid maintenance system antidote protein VapI